MVDLLFSRPAGLLLGRRTRRMYMNEMDLITKCAQNANGKLVNAKEKETDNFLAVYLAVDEPLQHLPPPPPGSSPDPNNA